MRVSILSSGSAGNCAYVEAPGARVLVDCGLSLRETARRLAEIGVDPRDLTGILLTHEHGDHACGAPAVARKLGVVVHATRGTLRLSSVPRELQRPFAAGESISLGVLVARPFAVPHDAAEPVAFVLEEHVPQLGLFGELHEGVKHFGGQTLSVVRVKVGIATDFGTATATVAERLRGCDALVLEMNHDERMLLDGPYPWSVKERVRSRRGHLSNVQGAGLLGRVVTSRTRRVVLAHISETNNTPDLARREAERVLERAGGSMLLEVARQAGPLEPMAI